MSVTMSVLGTECEAVSTQTLRYLSRLFTFFKLLYLIVGVALYGGSLVLAEALGIELGLAASTFTF